MGLLGTCGVLALGVMVANPALSSPLARMNAEERTRGDTATLPVPQPLSAGVEENPTSEPPPDRNDATDAPVVITVTPNPDAPLSRFQRDGAGLFRHTALIAAPLALAWVVPSVVMSAVAGAASLALAACPAAAPAAVVAPWTGLLWMGPGAWCWPPVGTGIATGIMQVWSDLRGPLLPPVLAGAAAGPVLGTAVMAPVVLVSLGLLGMGGVVVGGLARQLAQGQSADALQTGLLVTYMITLVLYPLVAPLWLAIAGAVASGLVGVVGSAVYRVLGRYRQPRESWHLDVLTVETGTHPAIPPGTSQVSTGRTANSTPLHLHPRAAQAF